MLPSTRSFPSPFPADLRARGSTHRSLGRPLGEESLPACRLGNTMVARCCLLIFLAAARGIWWILEQPRGSLLQYHPAFQLLSSMLKVYRKHIKMGNYGSLTEKATWLYSGPSLICSNSESACLHTHALSYSCSVMSTFPAQSGFQTSLLSQRPWRHRWD